MKITDRLTLRDKTIEQTLRQLETVLTELSNSNAVAKKPFMETHFLMLELLITVFKRLEDNTTPARTLLDYTNAEIVDACLRVGPSKIFGEDHHFVTAVLQALTK